MAELLLEIFLCLLCSTLAVWEKDKLLRGVLGFTAILWGLQVVLSLFTLTSGKSVRVIVIEAPAAVQSHDADHLQDREHPGRG
jgi:hypothetical protein